MRQRALEGGLRCYSRAIFLGAVHHIADDQTIAVILTDRVLDVCLHEVHLGDVGSGTQWVELLEKIDCLRRGESRAVKLPIDLGQEIVLRRDRALIYFPARDERIAIVPFVGQQATEQEEALRIGIASAGCIIESCKSTESYRVRP